MRALRQRENNKRKNKGNKTVMGCLHKQTNIKKIYVIEGERKTKEEDSIKTNVTFDFVDSP